MKTQHLLPIVAAAIGFAVAWIAKPEPASDGKPAAGQTAAPGPRPRPDSARTRPDPLAGRKPAEVRAGDFPLVDQAENGPKTRSEAKMLRLTEALGLTIDQQGEIIKAIEESKSANTGQVPVIEDLAVRGRKVEEQLAKILSPEQSEKFQELRARERDNRIELGANRALYQVLNEIDLSPGQRNEALARLRQAEKEKIQAVPASATLLLKTSVLPTDSKEMTMEGVLALSKLANSTPPENPETGHLQFIQKQKETMEEKLRCFDGILSPGQMGQYQAILAEQKSLLDRVPGALPTQAAPQR
jgi:hypothetical protein